MAYPTQKQLFVLIGINVKTLRKNAGLSQADLAYEADIDLSTLSRLERGNINVTIETLYKIAKALKIDIKDLF